MDEERDAFAKQPYGKVALRKLAPVPENFRLYSVGQLGIRPDEFSVIQVTGAQFRTAKRGPNKGRLTIMVPGTQRTTYVTEAEINAAALETGE